MRIVIFTLLMFLFNSLFCFASDKTVRHLSNYDEKLGYAFGVGVANSVQEISTDTDVEFFIRGIKDIYENNSPLLSNQAAKVLKWKLSRNLTGRDQHKPTLEEDSAQENDEAGQLSQKQKTGYALGMDYGDRLFKFVPHRDLNYVFQGIKDVLAGSSLLMQPNEALEIRSKLGESKDKKRMKELQQKSLYEGLEFIKKNKDKPGVLSTESGLQYKIITEGHGGKPREHDKVLVDYIGKLLDGTEFQKTTDTKGDILQVDQLIPGLKEGLLLMPIGSKYRFYVPARLAYGFKGYGYKIKPYAVLIFDIELKSIKRGEV